MNHRNNVVSYRRPAGPVVNYSGSLNGAETVAAAAEHSRPGTGCPVHKSGNAGSFTKSSRRWLIMELTVKSCLTTTQGLSLRARLRSSRDPLNPAGVGLMLLLALGAIDGGAIAVMVAMATLAAGKR